MFFQSYRINFWPAPLIVADKSGYPGIQPLKCVRSRRPGMKKKKVTARPLQFQTSSYTQAFPLPQHSFTMGTGKKEATRRTRQGKTGDGLGNVRVKGENFYRYV